MSEGRGALGGWRAEALAVALLLALHGWLALSATRSKSATYDEPLHLVSGYAYWTLDDYRLQPENGNLPQRWAALPLLRTRPNLPVEELRDAWRYTDAPTLMRAFLYNAGNDPVATLQAARRAAVVWSLALGLLVFCWARALWGPGPAFTALALFALSPTFLAHAPLVTSDACAAFFLLAACGAWWRALTRPSVAAVLLSGLATGLMAIAKYSVVMLPFAFLLMLAWLAWRCALSWRWAGAAFAANLVVSALCIWAAFGFRYAPGGDAVPELVQYYRTWAYVLPADGPVRAAMDAARAWKLLPDAYIYGFGHVQAGAAARSAFAAGEFGITGWWWFFPYAFAIKTPLAELALYAAALWLGLRALRAKDGRSERVERAVPLLALVLVYAGFSIASNLNIGHRHLLPVYPALLVLSVGALQALPSPRRTAVSVALVAVAAVESFAVRPHYLAFFNASVGGPRNGWRHLVDSSLDWGQDLPGLAAWLREHRRPSEPVYAALFGVAPVAAHDIEAATIAPDGILEERPWIEWTGGVYAVSATTLQGVYNPFRGRWTPNSEAIVQQTGASLRAEMAAGRLAPRIPVADSIGPNLWTLERVQFARLTNYLRLRTPDATIGHSIFIYRLSDDEARIAVRGSTQEYVDLVGAAR